MSSPWVTWLTCVGPCPMFTLYIKPRVRYVRWGKTYSDIIIRLVMCTPLLWLQLWNLNLTKYEVCPWDKRLNSTCYKSVKFIWWLYLVSVIQLWEVTWKCNIFLGIVVEYKYKSAENGNTHLNYLKVLLKYIYSSTVLSYSPSLVTCSLLESIL